MTHQIMVVEDDPNIRDIVTAYLKKEGYDVKTAESAEKAMELTQSQSPDMWILDIMLPGIDGYEFCKQIRQTSDVPIIIISAKDEELDKILGLELGSDDYLTKPFSPRELVARVKRHLKRWDVQHRSEVDHVNEETLKAGRLTIYPKERRIFWENQEVETSTKEFELLSILTQNVNRAFSREELLTRIWGFDYFGSDRAVDDLIKRLRKKLENLPIETVWGYGYRLRSEEDDK
ncbi:response regulator transcription factor [Aquibacillus sp. 3ASR75-11]|uniref:Response regulator transcription factor n=1 Tax=Terrihalobacillus insolitus TaxID=2950438 RepID=A0A9X3WVW6_9BACI|nr:response regulator transcription factor [Terrihalobacillus insolitus]MDC3425181.1 response regulator transcription factor [Terrihalobacillus insolitus]